MTGNPSERDDMDFDDEEGFVIDPGVDPSEPSHPLDEVFAEVDRELAKRRGMWTEAGTRLHDDDTSLDDDDEVFVLAEEGFEPEADAAPGVVPDAGVREDDLRVTVGGADDVFSADASMFEVDAATDGAAAGADVTVSAGDDDDGSDAELSMLDAMEATSAELEIIAEADDPFARLAAAGAPQRDGDDAAGSEGTDDWSLLSEALPQGDRRQETTWDEAQSEAAAAAFVEDAEAVDVEADDFASAAFAGDAEDDESAPDGVEDDFDPIYGEQQQEHADAEPVDEPGPEPDFGEYEDTYAEADPALVVIGAPVKRRRPWRAFAAAAVLLIAAGGTLAVVRPELIGLADPTPLIDRVEIARPTFDVEVAPPTPTAEPTVEPTVAQSAQPTPVIEPTPAPVVAVEPVPTPIEPTPVEPAPVATAPTSPVPVAAVPTGEAGPTNETSRIGEDLVVSVAEAPVRGRVHELADGIATGNQAFAQLKNLNFFVGRVKAMDANFITLALDPGEITLAFDELTAIVPLASEEYRLMQGGQESFVRLRNSNRLFGRILANGGIADNIVIEVAKNLVTIPRHAIEEIGGHSALGVQVLQDDGGDWVERLLRKKHAESGITAVPPIGAESPQPGK